jgi:hypothetical protein
MTLFRPSKPPVTITAVDEHSQHVYEAAPVGASEHAAGIWYATRYIWMASAGLGFCAATPALQWVILVLLQVVCMTLFRPSKLQLWWQESRSRTLLAAFLFADSTGATQALYVANVHLEGSPYKPQERLAQVSIFTAPYAASCLTWMAAAAMCFGRCGAACSAMSCVNISGGRSLTSICPCRLAVHWRRCRSTRLARACPPRSATWW